MCAEPASENPYQAPRAVSWRRVRRRAGAGGVAVVWTLFCFFASLDISGGPRLKDRYAMFVFEPDTAVAGVIAWGWLVVLVGGAVWGLGMLVIWTLSLRVEEKP